MPKELGRGVGLLCVIGVITVVAAVPGGVCSWRNLEEVSVTTGEGGILSISPLIAGEVGVDAGGGWIKSEMGVT